MGGDLGSACKSSFGVSWHCCCCPDVVAQLHDVSVKGFAFELILVPVVQLQSQEDPDNDKKDLRKGVCSVVRQLTGAEKSLTDLSLSEEAEHGIRSSGWSVT